MTPTAPQPQVAGLPEGVELVGLRAATADDYELVRDDKGPHILKGPRAGAASGVIVKPADGYKFVFDLREYGFLAIKQIAPKNIVVTAKFTVDNVYDEETINGLIERMKSVPGFVSLAQE